MYFNCWLMIMVAVINATEKKLRNNQYFSKKTLPIPNDILPFSACIGLKEDS